MWRSSCEVGADVVISNMVGIQSFGSDVVISSVFGIQSWQEWFPLRMEKANTRNSTYHSSMLCSVGGNLFFLSVHSLPGDIARSPRHKHSIR